MNETRVTWMGVLASVLMLSGYANATLLAYDGFDTAVTGDAVNGIYTDSTEFTATANKSVVGGDIVGMSTTYAWTAASGTPTATAAMGGINGGSLHVANQGGSSILTRRIAVNMTTQSHAAGSAWLRMDAVNTVNAQVALVGFTSTTGSTTAGAQVGFRWSDANQSWDLVALYRNTASVATYSVVQANLGTDTGPLFVVWDMNSADNKLDVWVNPANESATPTLSITDYLGTAVAGIQAMGLNAKFVPSSGTGFYADDIKLGNFVTDVIPEPITLNMVSVSMIGLLILRRAMIK